MRMLRAPIVEISTAMQRGLMAGGLGNTIVKGLWFSNKIGILGALTLAVLPQAVAALGRRFAIAVDRQYLPTLLLGYPNVIWMRLGSSDYDVMRQIFVVEEFQCIVDALDAPACIFDCGANAGYASLYFLERFPTANIVAIEPDDRNVEICRENLKGYVERTSIIAAGLWSHDVDLIVEKGVFADGREWATRVREAKPGERGDVRGVNIGTILDASGFDSIDLLKVDIENAERIVFASNFDQWLPCVKNIVIELHDEDCRRSFFAALAGYDYTLSQQGNLTICKALRKVQ